MQQLSRRPGRHRARERERVLAEVAVQARHQLGAPRARRRGGERVAVGGRRDEAVAELGHRAEQRGPHEQHRRRLVAEQVRQPRLRRLGLAEVLEPPREHPLGLLA